MALNRVLKDNPYVLSNAPLDLMIRKNDSIYEDMAKSILLFLQLFQCGKSLF